MGANLECPPGELTGTPGGHLHGSRAGERPVCGTTSGHGVMKHQAGCKLYVDNLLAKGDRPGRGILCRVPLTRPRGHGQQALPGMDAIRLSNGVRPRWGGGRRHGPLRAELWRCCKGAGGAFSNGFGVAGYERLSGSRKKLEGQLGPGGQCGAFAPLFVLTFLDETTHGAAMLTVESVLNAFGQALLSGILGQHLAPCHHLQHAPVTAGDVRRGE